MDRLKAGLCVDRAEIVHLLGLTDPEEIESLFAAARDVRHHHFGTGVFFYGFLYFSTFCRNNCRFCQYRNANTQLPRYRKTPDEIIKAAREMAATGVHLIDLTMGEDPEIYNRGMEGFTDLINTVRAVKKETGLPVMISPGALPDPALTAMAEAGCEWYACYQETHNRDHYHYLRLQQGFEERMEKKRRAKAQGMLIEEGLLTGTGESLEDIADSIFQMKELGVDQARIMTFVPQKDTPMGDLPAQNNTLERITIAVMRLLLPDRLIPASLDVDGLDGLAGRLDAGANVVTSIVPPEKGLAGVANNSLDIEDSRRTLGQIIPILESCGLTAADVDAYQTWIAQRMAGEKAA